MIETAKCPLVGEGFSLITPSVIERYPERVPRRPGVYTILLRGGDQLLSNAGYARHARPKPWRMVDFTHLYTGESGDLGGRLNQHLFGDADASGFRFTLMALAAEHDLVEGFLDLEVATRRHLKEHALIAFKEECLIGEVEERIVERSGSPLNIRAREPDEFTKYLRAARKRLRAKCAQALEKMSSASLRAEQVAPS